jgi:ubiquinone/menaquinone biosynthesis C-methylase UbiE
MDKAFAEKYFAHENEHWWFRARRDMILRLLHDKSGKKLKILEVGCSGGPLLCTLRQHGHEVYGIDINPEAITCCAQRGIPDVSLMDAAKLAFDDRSFDVVIASDILEHIADDAAALHEWRRVLKDNGKLLLFVPAHRFLWGDHDLVNHHFRRYGKRQLVALYRQCALNIEQATYWNFCLFFPAAVVRLLQRLLSKGKPQDQLYTLHPLLNTFLTALLKCENWLLQYINYPIGVSLMVIASK